MRVNRHAVGRAKERYGIDLSGGDLDQIAAQCDSSAPLKETDGDEVHRVAYRDQEMFVVYYRPMNRIITFLPGNLVEPSGHVKVWKKRKRRKQKAQIALVGHDAVHAQGIVTREGGDAESGSDCNG